MDANAKDGAISSSESDVCSSSNRAFDCVDRNVITFHRLRYIFCADINIYRK